MIVYLVVPLVIVVVWVVCVHIYDEYFASYVVKTGYCSVNQLTIAYRLAPRRQTSKDSRLVKSLPNGSTFKGLNICYSSCRPSTQKSINGRKNEVCQRSVIYAVGVVISERGMSLTEEEKKIVRNLGYRVITLPNITHAVTACYTIGNLLPIKIALQRVYPVIEQMINTHKLCAYPRLEIYNGNGVQVIIPLSRQICYFVPEVVPLSSYEWYLHSVCPKSRQCAKDN